MDNSLNIVYDCLSMLMRIETQKHNIVRYRVAPDCLDAAERFVSNPHWHIITF